MTMIIGDEREFATLQGARRIFSIRLMAPLIVASAAILAAMGSAVAQKTFYLDESTDFTGNGCENADLKRRHVAACEAGSTADGWTGQRFTNVNAWPQDYIEFDD